MLRILIAVIALSVSVSLGAKPAEYPSGLMMLKSGEVKPRGWILEQMRSDLQEGYAGCFDKLTPTASVGLFGETKADYQGPRPRGAAKTWWSAEVEAQWMDAVTRMAFLTDDSQYQEIAHRWVKDILAHQAEDGYIGMYKPELRFNHKVENGELWTMSRALLVLLAYAEYTGDAECLAAVKKAVALVMSKYDAERPPFMAMGKAGGITHGLAFVDVLEWLYRVTGDEQYVRFAAFLYEDYGKHSSFNTDLSIQNLLDPNRKFKHHGAHVAEQFMVPFFLANMTGRDRYRKAAANALEKFRFHHAPGGSINSVEAVKGVQGSADCLKEYCTFKSFLLSLNRVAMITGKAEVSDWEENIALNAAQAARGHPHLFAVEYCSSDNRVTIDEKAHGSRLMYAAYHGAAPCCAVSAAQLMSYYVEGMWMRRTDRPALVAMQYGPCAVKTQVNGISVQITEETGYPFSDELTVTVDPEREAEFALSFRKPGHVEGLEIADIPGATVSEAGRFVSVRKKWAKGDVVRVRFRMVVKKIAQPESETVRSKKGGFYLRRGPIVYALAFPHELKPIEELGDTGFKKYKVITKDRTGWDFSIDPGAAFALDRDEDADLLHPWAKSPIRLQGSLLGKTGERVPVSLVPMGATVLRRVTFPVFQPGHAKDQVENRGN
jgi:hypothetical protein